MNTLTFIKTIQFQERKPKVVCLCGSTRFMEAFQNVNLAETMKGNIVLSVGCNTKSDADLFRGKHEQEMKSIKLALDELHKRKIDLADEIIVLNVGKYIGDSTQSEIDYAQALGKPIYYLEPLSDGQRVDISDACKNSPE